MSHGRAPVQAAGLGLPIARKIAEVVQGLP
jgi:hypothetical protein